MPWPGRADVADFELRVRGVVPQFGTANMYDRESAS